MRRLLFITVLIMSFLSLASVQAQDSHELTPGQAVSGVVDPTHLTQTYKFQTDPAGSSGFTFENTGDLPLSVAVVDAAGNTVEHINAISARATSVLNWNDLAAGTYYLIVLPAGAMSASGTFTITLNPAPATTSTPPTITPSPSPTTSTPPTITPSPLPTTSTPPASELQFVLTWQAGARLSLESRNTSGESLHWHNTSTPDGGTFSGDTDEIDCASFAPHDQTQTIVWQGASAGSYEILVHYIDGCVNSVPFTVSTQLDGKDYPLLSGTAQPDKTFVSGFVVSPNQMGALDALSGMVNNTPTLTIATAVLLANAQPLVNGEANGHIGSDPPYQSYSFDGTIGQRVSVTVKRQRGSLDTILALIDGSGNLLAINDDAADDTTNSALTNVRLPRTQRYWIIVTRYADQYGATEGDYTVTLTGS